MVSPRLQQIFNKALEVFAEKGYAGAVMDEIAARAQVAKGTLYYHFDSKEDLFAKLIRNGLQPLLSAGQQALNHPSPQDIYSLIKVQVNFFAHNKLFCQVLLTEVWGASELQNQFRSQLSDFISLWAESLRKGQQAGFILPELDCETAAAACFGAVSIACLHWILKPNTPSFPVTHLENICHQLIISGLTKNKAGQ